jgi:hypothetical protein
MTLLWFVVEGQDVSTGVPCCRACAMRAEAKDFPDRKTWRRKEHIATGGAE